ncbi:MAG: hypothetical protein FJZ64_02040 [Chlamydiae bacterium]|nr:hypothetical protein [Chlamydiota bacterium]
MNSKAVVARRGQKPIFEFIYLSFEFEVVDLQNPCGDFYSSRSAMISFARMIFHTSALGSSKNRWRALFESQDSEFKTQGICVYLVR